MLANRLHSYAPVARDFATSDAMQRYLDKQRNAIELASRLKPWDSDIWSARSTEQASITWNETGMLELSEVKRANPDAFMRRALQLRPHSGILWAQCARRRLHEGAPLSEALALLDMARALAPHYLFVRKVEVSIGLSSWNTIDEQTRRNSVASLRYLLRLDPRGVVGDAVEEGWADALAPLLEDDRHIRLLEQARADRSAAGAPLP